LEIQGRGAGSTFGTNGEGEGHGGGGLGKCWAAPLKVVPGQNKKKIYMYLEPK